VPVSVRQNIRAVIRSLLEPDRASKRRAGAGEPSGTSCWRTTITWPMRTLRSLDATFFDRLLLHVEAALSWLTCEIPIGSPPSLPLNALLPFALSFALLVLAGDRGDDGGWAAATKIQAAFAERLSLEHVSMESIAACEGDPDRLQHLAEALHVQTESAIRVFDLLDADQRGVVVLEDLQRAAPDILGEGIGGGSGKSKDSWKEEDLVQMVSQMDRSGDGLLTRDDMIRIARTVGL
jgi:EF-hand domain pair